GARRADFPAPSACSPNCATVPAGNAWACGRKVACPRAKGRRSNRRTARRSARSPRAVSARRSMGRSPWVMSNALLPRRARRLRSSCAARTSPHRSRRCRSCRTATTAAETAPPQQSVSHEEPMTETRYTKDHEWIRLDGDTAVVGITEHAQSQLGDVVFVELPELGKKVAAGDEAAVVESVKAASEVYAPVSGQVVDVNAALTDAPAT